MATVLFDARCCPKLDDKSQWKSEVDMQAGTILLSGNKKLYSRLLATMLDQMEAEAVAYADAQLPDGVRVLQLEGKRGAFTATAPIPAYCERRIKKQEVDRETGEWAVSFKVETIEDEEEEEDEQAWS